MRLYNCFKCHFAFYIFMKEFKNLSKYFLFDLSNFVSGVAPSAKTANIDL